MLWGDPFRGVTQEIVEAHDVNEALVLAHERRPELVRPYRTLGYPVVPMLFVIGAGILLFSTALERPRESAMGLGLMALGLPFYYYWKSRRGEKQLRPSGTD